MRDLGALASPSTGLGVDSRGGCPYVGVAGLRGVGSSLAMNFVSERERSLSPRLGSGWTSKGGCPYFYFFASLFSLTFVFLWGASLLDAVERPAPGTCAGGAPDEGVRGYTNNFGLHKSRGTQNMFGATHFGGGE